MAADPDRIARAVVDGIVLSRADPNIRLAHPTAEDDGDKEIEMFFDDPADAAVLLDEVWNWRKQAGRPHEAVEVEASLGLGTSVPITPAAPQFTVVDDSRAVNALTRVRALAVDHTTDRHSVELLG